MTGIDPADEAWANLPPHIQAPFELSLLLGVAGTHRKHESVDVVYERDGKRLVETGLRPREE